MKITTFGSCRQHSIANHFPVTCIQEALTYPHYTKEIIQAIEYCKGAAPAAAAVSQYCFRSGLLAGKPIEYQQALQSEFDATDLFVVEIASRISYEWRGVYLHHIAAEEDKYGFPYRSEVVQRDIGDDEIEADILKIRDLLAPAKVIIVSHACTRREGRRYELVRLLEEITARHEIPFINPGRELEGVEDIYEGAAAYHYTTKGHYMMGYIYARTINDVAG